MYHEGTLLKKAYYDTLEEVPDIAKVYFPEEATPREMTISEMIELSKDGWYTIVHECNFGVCDHWSSWRLEDWVTKKFKPIIQLVDRGKTVGYNRLQWSVTITRDSSFWKSEVWNS